MQVGLSACPLCCCCLPGTPLLLLHSFLAASKHAQHSHLRAVPALQATVQLGSTKGLAGGMAIDLGQQSLPDHVEAFAAGRQGACTGLSYSADGSLLASAWSTGQVSCCARGRCWCSAAMHSPVACYQRHFALICGKIQLWGPVLTAGCPSLCRWRSGAQQLREPECGSFSLSPSRLPAACSGCPMARLLSWAIT